jgi:hypothetical protein
MWISSGSLTRLVGLAAAMAAAGSASADVPPELLQKLAAHAARMEEFSKANKAEVTSEYFELARNGEVEHHVHSESQVVLVDGKPVTRVLRATKDGRDNLRDSQEQAAKEDKKGRRLEPPFSEKNQPRYQFSMLGQAEGGLVRIGFGPRAGKSTEILEGEAVIDPVAGELVRMTAHPSKTPAFVDRLDMQLEYGAQASAGRMLSKLSFAAAGGFLFIRKRVKVEVTIRYD